MITHKCEACGKTEDITSHFDKDDGGRLSRVNSKLCHECSRIYAEINLDRVEAHNERHLSIMYEVEKKVKEKGGCPE